MSEDLRRERYPSATKPPLRVRNFPEALPEPLSDLLLTDTIVSALEVAASRRDGQPLGTFDLLAALIGVDPIGEWEWVQLQATPIVEDEAPRFRDPNSTPAGRWHNVPLTADATRASLIAKRIAQSYRLLPVPPGALALGLVWDRDSGATVALLDQSDLRHEQLLELIQEALLGGDLEGLRSLEGVDESLPHAAGQQDVVGELGRVLRDAAAIGPRRGGRDFAVVATPSVTLALLARDPLLWRQASARAEISLEDYEARLADLVADSGEAITQPESELDRALAGIRLTGELAAAIETAERLARHVAGSESIDVLSMLPPALVMTEGAASRLALPEHVRAPFAETLIRLSCGGRVPNLDELVARREAPTSEAAAPTPPPAPEAAVASSRSTSFGFNLGTFLGAFIVGGLGGLPLGVALGVAFMVRLAANRARKKVRPSRLIRAGAGIALVTAIALVATTATNFGDEHAAVQDLRAGELAISHHDLVGAMRMLASSALFENQSVRVRVLQACVDWDLRYRDEAATEAQIALTLGYRPNEETHYAGRSCFLDVPEFHGFGFLRVQPKLWLIYPRPYQTDARGLQLLEIAEQESELSKGDALIAIGCLADRYDLRSLAAFGFVVGINSNLKLFGRPTSTPALIRCLKSKSVNTGYRSFKSPISHAWIFIPADLSLRIPNPKRHRPPRDACWAHFPLRGPCNKT
jgi:hypothetical protein